MIKVENVDTWGFEAAIRGMRNPLNSWDKSDSDYGCAVDLCNKCINSYNDCEDAYKYYVIGNADVALMQKLFKGGSEHRKYLRQIFVSMDIVAPLYWWKEFDTYKVGTVANSCSTMHKIHDKEFTLDDFSHEHLTHCYDYDDDIELVDYEEYPNSPHDVFEFVIKALNHYRNLYLETKDKCHWWRMIQLLPSSYNQKRTITMNYENVVNMIHQRENHKLDEWREFVQELKHLPYVNQIMCL